METSFFEKLGCLMRAFIAFWLVVWFAVIIYRLIVGSGSASENGAMILGGILAFGLFWPISGLFLKSGEE